MIMKHASILPVLISILIVISCNEKTEKGKTLKQGQSADSSLLAGNTRVDKKPQSNTDEEQVVNMLTDFYTGYITIIAKGPMDYEDKLIALKEKCCTKKLLDKVAEDFKNELDYDPFINAQDSDVAWLKTLSVVKEPQKENTYSVSYRSNDTTKVVIHLRVIKQDDLFKIDGIL
jgi:Tfp pilus assembly protein PilN